MFFILSKLFYFLLQPFIWLLIIGFVWIKTKKAKRKKIVGWSFVIILFFFSNTAILKTFLYGWEIHSTEIKSTKEYDVAIVLGGMFEWDNDVKRLTARRGSDRLWQALSLYKAGKVKKLLISGASGYVTDRGLEEAKQVKILLVKWGIAETDIIIEIDSRNTAENAKFSKAVLDQSYPHLSKVLLITSARHMRRAHACFEKVGLKVDTFSTDQYTGGKLSYNWDEFIVPNANALDEWTELIKEYVGYIAYDVVGYI